MLLPVRGHFHGHAPKTADLAESRSERIMAWITAKVGTLVCAILFAVLAGLGAPAKFAEGTKGIVEWLAQQFLQLVLLAIILGGQKVTEKQGEKQTEHIALGIDTALDALDVKTQGGLAVLDKKLDQVIVAVGVKP
jgi:hypothetical protein